MRAIVSRAGFRGPGGAHVRASRDTPPTDGGSGLGTAQFCRPPRQSLRPRESHPGVIPGYPGLSRVKTFVTIRVPPLPSIAARPNAVARSPYVVAPARVASRGHPGLSRIIPD